MDLLPRARATFGETDNGMTLVTMRNLARIYWSQKRHDEAASVYEELLPLAEEHATRRMFGMILTDRGRYLTQVGDFEQAEQDLLKSHDIFNRELGTDNRLTIESLVALYEAWNKPPSGSRSYRDLQTNPRSPRLEFCTFRGGATVLIQQKRPPADFLERCVGPPILALLRVARNALPLELLC